MLEDIVDQTIKEWTEGLGPTESRIAVFERIRDIPYLVIPEIRGAQQGPRGLLVEGRGSCTPKHFLLGSMFERLRIPIKYVTYVFSWNDPDLPYPQRLRELAERTPPEFHLNCNAHLGGRWVAVDVTWDPPLSPAGFPINEHWDGMSDTRIAVKPMEMIVHGNADERDQYVEEMRSHRTTKQEAAIDEFIEELNRWLENIRKGRDWAELLNSPD